MKSKKTTSNLRNAGRKKEPDLKDTIVLMVRRSYIVGKGNLEKPIKNASGEFTPEYIEAKNKLKEMLYETIEFNNINL